MQAGKKAKANANTGNPLEPTVFQEKDSTDQPKIALKIYLNGKKYSVAKQLRLHHRKSFLLVTHTRQKRQLVSTIYTIYIHTYIHTIYTCRIKTGLGCL